MAEGNMVLGKLNLAGIEYDIILNEDQHYVSITIDGREARLSFSEKDGRWLMYRTFTPPELRGNGIAAAITKAALKEARRRGYKVIPSCSYVHLYLEQNPEFKSLI